MLRSIRREDRVKNHRLNRGTARRVLALRPAVPPRHHRLPASRSSSTPSSAWPPRCWPARWSTRSPAAARRRGRDVVRIAVLIAGAGRRRRAAVARPAVVFGAHRRGHHLRPADPGLRPRPADAAAVLHPHPDRRAGQPAQQRRDRRPAGVHLDAVRRGQQRDPAGADGRRDVHAVLADHRAVAAACCRCSCCRPGGSASGWPRSPASPTSSTPR